MLEKYRQWIDEHYPTRKEAHHRCFPASKAMAAAFPELIRVRGHYRDAGEACEHWWLKTAAGEIIDPTFRQFPEFGHGTYTEYHGPDPITKCWNCGEWVWDRQFSGACSQECMDDLNAEMREIKEKYAARGGAHETAKAN